MTVIARPLIPATILLCFVVPASCSTHSSSDPDSANSSGGAQFVGTNSGGAPPISAGGSPPGTAGSPPSAGTSSGLGGFTSAGAGQGGLPIAASGGVPATTMGGAGGESQTGGCPRQCGPTFDQFFDNSKLATLRVELDAADLGRFGGSRWLDYLWSKWSHCKPFFFVPSQMAYESPDGLGNVTLDAVGMRLRGSWQRGTNQLQGFKLDVQVLDTPGPEGKRRFADLNRVNELSIESDPSHMLQCLSYGMLRDFGVQAPRCNHLKVYVNGEYYGLMENVEQVNKGYVRRHFGTNQGSLYAGSPSSKDCPDGFADSKATLRYSGDSFSTYADQYELASATSTDAESNLIPMLKCGDATQTPDDAAFRACISEWIDVDEWLKQIAVESILPTLESLVGYYRNFYLYFTPDAASPHGGRFSIWSWDLDATFQRQRCSPSNCDVFTGVSSFYGPRNARAPLIRRLTTVFHQEYCAALNDFLSNHYTTAAVDQMASVMEPGMMAEPTTPFAQWRSSVDAIKNHIAKRTAEVRVQIDAACR